MTGATMVWIGFWSVLGLTLTIRILTGWDILGCQAIALVSMAVPALLALRK